jgi:hypothetical protein
MYSRETAGIALTVSNLKTLDGEAASKPSLGVASHVTGLSGIRCTVFAGLRE